MDPQCLMAWVLSRATRTFQCELEVPLPLEGCTGSTRSIEAVNGDILFSAQHKMAVLHPTSYFIQHATSNIN